MGQALIKGLRASGVGGSRLIAADASAEMLRLARKRYGVRTTRHNREAVRKAEVIVLAVKPQQMPDVLADLAPELRGTQLVISIAAGMSLRWLRARMPGVPVIRVMPNLPATVGEGFSALAAGPGATTRHRALAAALFGAVGQTCELPERHFDAITAVSGSGPAYLFFLVRIWQAAARRLGLPEEVTVRAVRQTLKGSLRLLEADGGEPEDLIARVASKRGTTEAALKILAKRRVEASFAEALRAAARRSKEFSWTSSGR